MKRLSTFFFHATPLKLDKLRKTAHYLKLRHAYESSNSVRKPVNIWAWPCRGNKQNAEVYIVYVTYWGINFLFAISFCSPGRSQGRAIVLPAAALAK